MAVTYKKLFHLLIDRSLQPAELTEKAGFSANILTRLKRDQYVSLESIEKICLALNCKVDDILDFMPVEKEIESGNEGFGFSPAGVLAPKSKADLAFIMHPLAWLTTSGTAAIVCFSGIMYRGGAEKKIRQCLIDNNFIDCIIQLPSNLFFGTSIATCIMVLKRSKSDNRTLSIDASGECVKVTNNKLTEENIAKIVAEFVSRADVDYFARYVPYDEIAGNDYNLSVSTYVEAEDIREVIDIVKLNAEIREIVAREQVLRDEIDKIIAEIEVG